MRGFPLMNLLLALLLSGAVLLPLVVRATRSNTPAVVEPGAVEVSQTRGISLHVRLEFVHAPVSVRLMNGGAVLWDWPAPGGAMLIEERMEMPITEQRCEFTVEIAWPAGTPRSIRCFSSHPVRSDHSPSCGRHRGDPKWPHSYDELRQRDLRCD